MNQIKHIRLDRIKIPSFDNRLLKSPIDDDELMNSIRELGVLEPILVKEVTDGFEIIFGNRRYHEAGRAGLAAVPCIVTKVTGSMSEKIKLHENIKRLPLSHIDQAYTFAHLMKEYKMTELQVATMVGKSIAYVSQHLSLLQSDPTLIQAVHDGRINFSVARELVQCKDPDDRQRLSKIVEEHGATSSVVHDWVRESNRETDIMNGKPTEDPVFHHPSETPISMYPCATCETPIPISEIHIIRLCENCNYMFFSTIEHNKFQKRKKQTSEPPITSP